MAGLIGVTDFIQRLYQLGGSATEDAAVDWVYNTIDDWLAAGEVAVCDLALSLADPGKMMPSVAISCLMATCQASGDLRHREEFRLRTLAVYGHVESFLLGTSRHQLTKKPRPASSWLTTAWLNMKRFPYTLIFGVLTALFAVAAAWCWGSNEAALFLLVSILTIINLTLAVTWESK